jgi:serine/threonine protein kinase
MAATLAPGQRLATAAGGEVVVREWRGEGSYARLYRGEHRTDGPARACAVKLARLETREAARLLAHEREVLALGPFENVVELLDYGDAGAAGAPYLVLGWIEGAPLGAVVERRRQLPLVNALSLLRDAAAGVARLHARGIAHADLRAANVLVLPGERQARLADLGAALRAGEPGHDGARRADLRRLGELLHLMLTGAAPDGAAPRLIPAAGYPREVVALFRASQAELAPDLRGFLARTEELLDRLGAPGVRIPG